MKKIIVVIILILIVGAVLLFFSGSRSGGYIDGSEALEKYDTSGKYCENNIDCTCASFTGAGFIEEEIASVCEKETNSCAQCYYE